MTTPAPMPAHMPATTVLKPAKKRLTARELYAIVQFAARARHGRTINTLRQIDAGQQVRLRTVLERDAALTFVARAKGSIVPVDPRDVKDATDMASNATMRLKSLPLGKRSVRRLAARELDRAKRRMARPKTDSVAQ